MAIRVYGARTSTATQRVLACLIEKELVYQFVLIDMEAGEHKEEPYLSINPFGQVPAFEDGDLKLFESRAICQYIAFAYADKGTPLVFQDPKKMASVCVGMEVENHHYNGPASKVVFELVVKLFLGMPTDEIIAQEQQVQLAKVLDMYESRLTEYKYLAGETFTLADLYHLPTVDYLMATRARAIFEARPHVIAWCNNIMSRPSWLAVIAMKNDH